MKNNTLIEICQECNSYEMTDKWMLREGETEPFTKFCKFCDLWLCFPCFDEHLDEIHTNHSEPRLEYPNLGGFMRQISIFIAFTALASFSACRGLNRLTSATPNTNEAPVLADNYSIQGFTTQDFQTVPVRTENSKIEIKVKKPGDTTFGTLNKWEFTVKPGYVQFQSGVVVLPDGKLWLLQKPVAPAGTEYEINSSL